MIQNPRCRKYEIEKPRCEKFSKMLSEKMLRNKNLKFWQHLPLSFHVIQKNKKLPTPGIEKTRKNKKRIARTHDPMFTLSQNGYGTN